MRHAMIVLGVALLPALAAGCKPPPPAAKAAQPQPQPQPVKMEQVKVGVGVGRKGRSLDGESGIYVTPVKAYFAAKEKIAFEIEVPAALNYYKAEHGYAPRSHEEFLEVMKAQRIKLPELPPGHRYVYNPETEELMVERPAKPAPGQP